MRPGVSECCSVVLALSGGAQNNQENPDELCKIHIFWGTEPKEKYSLPLLGEVGCKQLCRDPAVQGCCGFLCKVGLSESNPP